MTQEQTIKVLELINAFYAGGRNDPKQQAVAWHLVLQAYDFNDAMSAVLNFARNDRRDYTTFPAVGNIIAEIEKIAIERHKPVKEILIALQYGSPYDKLTKEAKELITLDRYVAYLLMDGEEIINELPTIRTALLGKVKMLRG